MPIKSRRMIEPIMSNKVGIMSTAEIMWVLSTDPGSVTPGHGTIHGVLGAMVPQRRFGKWKGHAVIGKEQDYGVLPVPDSSNAS